MKLATVEIDGRLRVGRIDADEINLLDMADIDVERAGVAGLIARPLPATVGSLAMADAVFRAPIPRPHRNIFCVGKNYAEHAKEFTASGFDNATKKGAVPDNPIIFSKVPETVIGPRDPIRIDASVSSAIDYEAELAVIIGREGRAISKERALDHVWGYTIVNDVTARDLQVRHSQWLIGKSQDSFCPMGPIAVTADEIDLADTTVQCSVNGDKRQDSNTALMVFDVPTIISTISSGITLRPGDVIATGTPAGVGVGFDPPKYLKPGDEVEVFISGIGSLTNPVEAL